MRVHQKWHQMVPGGASNYAPSHRTRQRRCDPPFWASGAPPVCIRSTMATISPRSNKTSLNPFLLSEGACEAGKHEKNGARKAHQMMPKASNDALGRIDTRDREAFLFQPTSSTFTDSAHPLCQSTFAIRG